MTPFLGEGYSWFPVEGEDRCLCVKAHGEFSLVYTQKLEDTFIMVMEKQQCLPGHACVCSDCVLLILAWCAAAESSLAVCHPLLMDTHMAV